MHGTKGTPADSRWDHLAIVGLILVAWGVLAVWSASPFAELLNHQEIGVGKYPLLLSLAVFILGWILMIIAMMLPSSLPIIHFFRRKVLHQPNRNGLVALLILGYLGVWTAFGGLAYLGDSVIHQMVERLPPSPVISVGIASGILLAAGLYQFTPLKRICLEKCCWSYSFPAEYGTGPGTTLAALRLGLQHGLFCVGCCWALTLLMFAVGGANLGWMLTLSAIMAAERVSRWGRYFTRSLGLALVVWMGLYLISYLPFPTS